MAHDSRCENANTPPSDCDCECGGDKHGNGFAEQQIHELETDIDEINQLKQLTPDEYFGEDAKGPDLIERTFSEFSDRINELREQIESSHDKEETLDKVQEIVDMQSDLAALDAVADSQGRKIMEDDDGKYSVVEIDNGDQSKLSSEYSKATSILDDGERVLEKRTVSEDELIPRNDEEGKKITQDGELLDKGDEYYYFIVTPNGMESSVSKDKARELEKDDNIHLSD